jgi:RHS repeat-associated protein
VGIASSGATLNNYLFAGEQYDPNIGLYYLRARYYDQDTGRFFSIDPVLGDPQSPISLHKYLYANDNPVNFVDPTGKFTLIEIQISITINTNLQSIYIKHMLKFFLNAVEIAFCQLQPAYELRWFAMELLMRGIPGGDELYGLAMRMISDSFFAIAKAAAQTYISMANDVIPKVETKLTGLLVDLVQLRTKILNKLKKLKNAYLQAAVLVNGGGSNCDNWKAISFFANEAIDNLL